MPIYSDLNGTTLLTGVTDTQVSAGLPGYALQVRRVNGALPNTWPVTVALVAGRYNALVYQDGLVQIEAVSDGDNPANGSTVTLGSFTYTVWNGVLEGPTRTHTVQLTGATSLVDSSYVSAGLIALWRASTNVTLSGSNVTAWTDTVSSRALTLVGVPTVVAPPGGTSARVVVVGSDQGFTFDATGFPQGNADRTLQTFIRFTGTQRFFGGFGYGTNSAGQAFTLSVNDQGELALDVSSSRYLLGIVPTNQWLMMTARHAAGVLSVWLGLNKVFEQAVSLNTGLTRGNVCRSFSNQTTTAEIGMMAAYGRALTDAEIQANVLVANAEYFGDTTATAHGSITASNIGPNAFTISASAGEVWGSVVRAVRAGTTAMSEAEIQSGAGTVLAARSVLNNSAAWTNDVTGAANSTTYRAHAIFYDMVGGKSSVVSSGNITTLAPADTTAPGLAFTATFPKAAGTSALDVSFTVDEAVSWIVGGFRATATAPDAAQVLAGTDGDGNPLLDLNTGSAGAAGTVTDTVTGLLPTTAYRIAVRAEDPAGNVTLLLSGSVNTDSLAATVAEQVDALYSVAGLAQYTTALIPLNTGTIPSDWKITGNQVYPLVDNPTPLIGYDGAGFRACTDNKDGVVIRYCRFGPNSAGSYTAAGGLSAFGQGYYVYLTPGSDDCTFEYLDLVGFDGDNWGESACFGKTFSGTGAGATTGARNKLRYCRMWNYQSDAIHDAGGGPNPGDEMLIEYNWIGLPAQWNSDILPYSGNPGDYVAGSACRIISGGLEYTMVCITPSGTAALAPVRAGNTDWEVWTADSARAHTDVYNPRAMLGVGSIVRRNRFQTDNSDTTYPQTRVRMGNMNQALRFVLNSGVSTPYGKILIQDNRIDRNPQYASNVAQGNTGSLTTGPWDFIDNRITTKSSGSWWSSPGQSFIGTFTGNTRQGGLPLSRP